MSGLDHKSGLAKRLRQIIPFPAKNFAEKIGIPAKRLSAYLTGRSGVPVEVLARIAEVTDVDMTWLLTGKTESAESGSTNVPIVGRATAGKLAPAEPGDEALDVTLPGDAEKKARTVRLDVADVRITIRVEPRPRGTGAKSE